VIKMKNDFISYEKIAADALSKDEDRIWDNKFNDDVYLFNYSTRSNRKTYSLNKTLMGWPIAEERSIIFEKILATDNYVTSKHPLQFKCASFAGEFFKKGKDHNELIAQYRPWYCSPKECGSIKDVVDWLKDVEKIGCAIQPIYHKYRKFRGGVSSEHDADVCHYPFIEIDYDFKAGTPSKIQNKWNSSKPGNDCNGASKYSMEFPLILIVEPRFPILSRVLGPIKSDKLTLKMVVDREKEEREKIYAELLNELKSLG